MDIPTKAMAALTIQCDGGDEIVLSEGPDGVWVRVCDREHGRTVDVLLPVTMLDTFRDALQIIQQEVESL